jgi:hypothetical protein
MNVVRWIVQSRIWVALAAASWSIESFVRSEEWVRWTLVTHIFFLTWTAYLFLSDDAIRKHRGLVLIALTGVCVTFQGFENVLVPASCALPVLLYRTHWMPLKWRLARYPLRSVPLVNNGIIAFCWVTLCMVWPFIQAGIDLKSQVPFLLAAFLWILALSMSEDLFVEHTPDATLRLLGNRRLRLLAITLVLISMILSWCYEEVQISVWLSLSASFILLFFMPGGKRTAGKSLLIDAMILLRFPV